MAPVKFQTFPCVPSGLPVGQQAGFDPMLKLDSLAPLVYVNTSGLGHTFNRAV